MYDGFLCMIMRCKFANFHALLYDIFFYFKEITPESL